MAKLTITDRNLLVDEILSRLEKESLSKEEQWKKIIVQEGLVETFDQVSREVKKIKKLEDKLNTLKIELGDFCNSINRKYDLYADYKYINSLDKVRSYLLDEYGEQLPSRKEIETAILLSSGGDDMAALMNSVIEQLKNK